MSSKAGRICWGGTDRPVLCSGFGLAGGFPFAMGVLVGVTGGTAVSAVVLKLRSLSGFGAGDRGMAELDWGGALFMLSNRASRDETGLMDEPSVVSAGGSMASDWDRPQLWVEAQRPRGE